MNLNTDLTRVPVEWLVLLIQRLHINELVVCTAVLGIICNLKKKDIPLCQEYQRVESDDVELELSNLGLEPSYNHPPYFLPSTHTMNPFMKISQRLQRRLKNPDSK